MSPFALVRRSLYRLGLLSAYHRLRNREQLTVVMFHRVLAQTDQRWADADPEWTMSDVLFEECVDFFRKHYHVISLDDLMEASQTGGALPDCPLLISFDDGWADNEEYALKVLRRARLPAVVFVVADGVGRKELWQEAVRRVWRQRLLREEHCRRIWKTLEWDLPPCLKRQQDTDIEALILAVASVDPAKRTAVLSGLGRILAEPSSPHMLNKKQLRALHSAGISIGSHGLTHVQICFSLDPQKELEGSRAALAELLGQSGEQGPVAFSFPHGIYDAEAIKRARAAGYRLLFTSEPYLNPISKARGWPALFGRISIPAHQISDRTGYLRPELLAFWLFVRPRVSLNAQRHPNWRHSYGSTHQGTRN